VRQQPIILTKSVCGRHYAARATACRGSHIGSLQELTHTICAPVVPLCITFYDSIQGWASYNIPPQSQGNSIILVFIIIVVTQSEVNDRQCFIVSCRAAGMHYTTALTECARQSTACAQQHLADYEHQLHNNNNYHCAGFVLMNIGYARIVNDCSVL
jgi:hypothetical protein